MSQIGPLTRAIFIALAANTCRAADQGELTPYPYAYARRDCAPWDGPAFSVVLTDTPAQPDSLTTSFLRIAVWRGIESAIGRTLAWEGTTSQVGTASRCQADGRCEEASRGEIRVEWRTADSLLGGEFRVDFGRTRSERGRFTAAWVPDRVMCG